MKAFRTNLSVLASALVLSLVPVGAALAGGASAAKPVTAPVVEMASIPEAAATADFNHSGAVSVDDWSAYMAAFFAGDPRADTDGDGVITLNDLYVFMNLWIASVSE